MIIDLILMITIRFILQINLSLFGMYLPSLRGNGRPCGTDEVYLPFLVPVKILLISVTKAFTTRGLKFITREFLLHTREP